MNTKSLSSEQRERLLTMLRTAQNRKVAQLQESLPSIREQIYYSVVRRFLSQLNLIKMFEKVRALRMQVLGSEKPSDTSLAELADGERELRTLGFEVCSALAP